MDSNLYKVFVLNSSKFRLELPSSFLLHIVGYEDCYLPLRFCCNLTIFCFYYFVCDSQSAHPVRKLVNFVLFLFGFLWFGKAVIPSNGMVTCVPPAFRM